MSTLLVAAPFVALGLIMLSISQILINISEGNYGTAALIAGAIIVVYTILYITRDKNPNYDNYDN